LLVNLPNPHLGIPTRFSTLEVLRARERAPIPSPFVVFTFELKVESIKELGGVSNALLKVQNQTLANKNLKWKEWWKTMQKIT
jgi:hypothetical protein